MNRVKGFSLIELLIVVAILLIIAAIAIPNLVRSRMAANEASAIASLRTVATANVTYSNAYNIGYAGDLNHLGPPAGGPTDSTHADLLDSAMSGGCPTSCTSNAATKSGHNFSYDAPSAAPSQAAPNISYTMVAVPAATNTGTSTFCVDQTNIILKDPAAAQTSAAGAGCIADGWTGGSVAPI